MRSKSGFVRPRMSYEAHRLLVALAYAEGKSVVDYLTQLMTREAQQAIARGSYDMLLLSQSLKGKSVGTQLTLTEALDSVHAADAIRRSNDEIVEALDKLLNVGYQLDPPTDAIAAELVSRQVIDRLRAEDRRAREERAIEAGLKP